MVHMAYEPPLAMFERIFHRQSPMPFGNTSDPQSFASLYENLLTDFCDSRKSYNPVPLLVRFIQEFLPQFTTNQVMNAYFDSEFLFEKLAGTYLST